MTQLEKVSLEYEDLDTLDFDGETTREAELAYIEEVSRQLDEDRKNGDMVL